MPLTPFHLGPGALFKAIGGRHFSFMIFGGSQVLMDIEPLIRIVRHASVIHGPSHTLIGATAIGLASAVIGRPICEAVLRFLNISHPLVTWTVAFVSAFVGTYSHILLDGMMHRDMKPFWPIASGNPLLGLISVGALYLSCVVAGILALAIFVSRGWRV